MWDKQTMTVSVRLDEATVKGLKQLAAADDRKLSPYIARLLKQHVEAAEAAGQVKPARRR
jgi:predicted transcriptional regulator